MNTPITDAAEMTGFPTPRVATDGWVSSDFARRLELDRAALMEALEEIKQHDGGNRYNYGELSVLAESALVVARANFPEQ